MNIVSVYAVYGAKPGDSESLVGVFSSYENAYRASDKQGVWGTRGVVSPCKGVITEDGLVYLLKGDAVELDKNLTTVDTNKLGEMLNTLTDREKEELKKTLAASRYDLFHRR